MGGTFYTFTASFSGWRENVLFTACLHRNDEIKGEKHCFRKVIRLVVLLAGTHLHKLHAYVAALTPSKLLLFHQSRGFQTSGPQDLYQHIEKHIEKLFVVSSSRPG